MIKPKVEITISNRTIVRVILIVLATFLGIRFLINISHALTLIFASFFLALALNPAVSWISRHSKIKSRATATGIAYVSVLAFLMAFVVAVVPPLARQTTDFISELPATVESMRDANSGIGGLVQKYNLQDSVDAISGDLGDKIKHLPQPVLSTAGKIGSGLVSLIAVLFMTFMMLVEGPAWLKKILELQAPKHREHTKRIALQMYGIVTNYVNGQMLISAIATTFAFVAMVIASNVFDVYINALGLAGIVALFGLIPMIGNTMSAIIVILVSALSSFPLAITMGVFFLVYQQVENVTLQPYIQSKKNELTPLVVFIAALCGIGLGGLMGGFVAIPLAGCIRILINDHYVLSLSRSTAKK